MSDIHAVDEDATLGAAKNPQQRQQQRRLAGAGAAHHADLKITSMAPVKQLPEKGLTNADFL